MAQQLINLGTPPAAMDGDDARTAFTKTNNNFTELYSSIAGKLNTGDYGLGGAAAALAESAINTADRPSGFYFVTAAGLGTLPVNANGYLIHIDNATTGFAYQRYIRLTTGAAYTRQYSSGSWGAWLKETDANDFTANSTDNTAGKGLKVGDFGLGSSSGVSIGSAANSAPLSVANGMYVVLGSDIGSPGGIVSAAGYLIHQRASASATQIWMPSSSPARMFTRTYASSAWTAWAESWHDGNTPKQTSLADNTAGRMLTTGSANILGFAVTTSFDDLLGSRFFRTNAGVPPVLGTTICGGVSFGVTGAIEQQIAARLGRIFFRSKGDTTGADWSELYHQGSVVGTVSQTAGKPTGAIIERGSNANGEYVKFADGTMICTHGYAAALTMTAYGTGGIYKGTFTWTFPATFSGAPAMSGTGVDQGTHGFVGGSPGSGTSMAVAYYSTSSSVTSSNIKLTAIGRWF